MCSHSFCKGFLLREVKARAGNALILPDTCGIPCVGCCFMGCLTATCLRWWMGAIQYVNHGKVGSDYKLWIKACHQHSIPHCQNSMAVQTRSLKSFMFRINLLQPVWKKQVFQRYNFRKLWGDGIANASHISPTLNHHLDVSPQQLHIYHQCEKGAYICMFVEVLALFQGDLEHVAAEVGTADAVAISERYGLSGLCWMCGCICLSELCFSNMSMWLPPWIHRDPLLLYSLFPAMDMQVPPMYTFWLLWCLLTYNSEVWLNTTYTSFRTSASLPSCGNCWRGDWMFLLLFSWV